jgi:hypothetical protein
MKTRRSRISTTVIGALCGIMVLLAAGTGEAGSGDYGKFAAEWWKWVYSIPRCRAPAQTRSLTQRVVTVPSDSTAKRGSGSARSRYRYAQRLCTRRSEIFSPVVNNAFFNCPTPAGRGREFECRRVGAIKPSSMGRSTCRPP